MSELLNLIQDIRKEWFNIVLLLRFSELFETQNVCKIVKDDLDTFFKCSNTANILWYLFFQEKPNLKYDFEKNNEILKSFQKNDISITFVNLNSIFDDENEYFPEHVWLILQLYDKYYILQSFYSAYTINSNYGFFEIQDVNEYFQMLFFLNEISFTKKMNQKELQKYQTIYEKSIHIDIEKWPNKYNYENTEKQITFSKYVIHDISSFTKNVSIQLSNFVKNENQKILFDDYRLILFPTYLNKVFTIKDLENADEFIDNLSKITGLETKYFNLSNMSFENKNHYQYNKTKEYIEVLSIEFKIKEDVERYLRTDLNNFFKKLENKIN